MANSNDSVVSGKFRGTLGKEIVFREWQGKTVVAKHPKKRSKAPTPAQAETQEKFMIASRYAKAVAKGEDTGLAVAYAAVLKPRQNVYSRAMEDFLSPPKVVGIEAQDYTGAAGTAIAIRAFDDYRVVSVKVEIHTASGSLLESGNAQPRNNGIDWIYTATQANGPLTGSTIKAIATDVPGNNGALELVL